MPNASLAPASDRRRFAWSDPPIPGESLLGFVARNAAKHGIKDMISMLRAAGIETLKPCALPVVHFDAVPELAHVFKTTGAEISARFYRPVTAAGRPGAYFDFFGAEIRDIYRAAGRRRVSPASLAISPHHRAVWDLRSLAFCPESKEILIDACPKCGAALGWRWTRGVHVCESCGADLREFPQPKIEEDLHLGLDLVVGIVDPSPKGIGGAAILDGNDFVSGSAGEMFEFALALAWAFSKPAAPRETRRFDSVADIEAIRPGDLAAAGELIGDWDRFADVAAEFRSHREGRPGYYGIDKDMGRLAELAADPFLNDELRALMARSIERAIKDSPMPVAGRRVKVADGSLVSVLEASQILGCGRRTIVAWRDAGLIELISPDGSERAVKLMRRDDIDAIADERAGAVSRADASVLLGLGDNDVAALSVHGLLRKIEGPAAWLMPMEHYPRAQLDSLVETLWMMSAIAGPGGAAMPLKSAVAEANLGQGAWGLVLAAALDGTISLYRRAGAPSAPLADALLVRSSQPLSEIRPRLDQLLHEDKAATSLSVREASAFLGVGRPSIQRLANNGLIPQGEGGADKLDRADLYWFRLKYVMTSEVARLAGTTSRKAVELLMERGVQPARRLSDDGDFVWLRNDVETALGLSHAAVGDDHTYYGPGVFFVVGQGDNRLSVYVTIGAIRQADPQWKEGSMFGVLDANREIFEQIAQTKAAMGDPCGTGKVRIEKKDLLDS